MLRVELLEVEKENGDDVTLLRFISRRGDEDEGVWFETSIASSIAPPGACMPACVYLPVLAQAGWMNEKLRAS